MKIFKEIGLIVLGMLIMFTMLMLLNLNARIIKAERNINQIVQFINDQANKTQPTAANVGASSLLKK